MIYDMRTGKPKNRTEDEFNRVLNEYNGKVAPAEDKRSRKAAPAIIKKISSKVTALFGKRGD